MKKVAAGASCDKEWVPSLMGETELIEMVEAGVLPDRVTARWRLANGEPYPMPLFLQMKRGHGALGEPASSDSRASE